MELFLSQIRPYAPNSLAWLGRTRLMLKEAVSAQEAKNALFQESLDKYSLSSLYRLSPLSFKEHIFVETDPSYQTSFPEPDIEPSLYQPNCLTFLSRHSYQLSFLVWTVNLFSTLGFSHQRIPGSGSSTLICLPSDMEDCLLHFLAQKDLNMKAISFNMGLVAVLIPTC